MFGISEIHINIKVLKSYIMRKKIMDQFIIHISTCKSFTTKTSEIHIFVNIINLFILFLFQIIVIAYFSIYLLSII